jgi:hypothetical protein
VEIVRAQRLCSLVQGVGVPISVLLLTMGTSAFRVMDFRKCSE